jgi:hypothetical protein
MRKCSGSSITGSVSGPVLARWLGATDKTVRELAKAGIVLRAGRGLYRLEESVCHAIETIVGRHAGLRAA